MTNGGVNWACSFGDESGGRDGDEGCGCNGRGDRGDRIHDDLIGDKIQSKYRDCIMIYDRK